MATGNMYMKFCEVWTYFETCKWADRHTHMKITRFTPLPGQGYNNCTF